MDFTGECPITVSSNRFNDLKLYCGHIYNAEPEKWGDILPWEFPPAALREDEEAFLRKLFDERAIHMQGGAGGEGLGFRFLKQVWWCIALWNWEHRIPAISNWWMDRNQEIWTDPNMLESICAGDAEIQAFFPSEDEVKMYGEKLLRWVVKDIQYKVKHLMLHNGARQQTPKALDPATRHRPNRTHGDKAVFNSGEPKPDLTKSIGLGKTSHAAVALSSKTVHNESLASVDIATDMASLKEPSLDSGQLSRGIQSSLTAFERGKNGNKCHVNHKGGIAPFNQNHTWLQHHNLFSQRLSQPCIPYPTTSNFPPTHAVHIGQLRFRPRGPLPEITPRGAQPLAFPGVPPPGHFRMSASHVAALPYATPMLSPDYTVPTLQSPNHTAYGRTDQTNDFYRKSLFSNRAPFHADLCTEQRVENYDGIAPRGNGKFRKTMSGRGRIASRGKSNYSKSHPETGLSDTRRQGREKVEDDFSLLRNSNSNHSPKAPRKAVHNKDIGKTHRIMEPQIRQQKNTLSTPEFSGPPTGSRRSPEMSETSNGIKLHVSPSEPETQEISSTRPHPASAPAPSVGTLIHDEGDAEAASHPEHVLTKNFIGKECKHVRTLIVLNLPQSLKAQDIWRYFARFGKVTAVLILEKRNTYKQNVWIDFESYEGAREALRQNGEELGGRRLKIEVPSQYWDQSHRNYPWGYSSAMRKAHRLAASGTADYTLMPAPKQTAIETRDPGTPALVQREEQQASVQTPASATSSIL